MATTCIGPIFSVAYNGMNGVPINLPLLLLHLVTHYVAPGGIFVAGGLVTGQLLSHILPALSGVAARGVSIGTAAVLFGAAIALSLTESLNFVAGPGWFELHGFSIACGVASFLVTTVTMSISKPLSQRES